ncbi:hypothetical protein BM451_14785 [Dickeya dadantii]|nr:hypothetical protein BM451_14785 [Dickeya dadantii]
MKIRIFSLRGAHPLAMFARTPVAKESRRWVLDILGQEVMTRGYQLKSEWLYCALVVGSLQVLLVQTT